VTLSFRQTAGRVIWANDLGHWTILTNLGGPVGPGYISRFKTRAGVFVNDDLRAGEGFLNDPHYGGLGTFGWHHARRLERGELGPDDEFGAAVAGAPNDWLQNNAWPVDGRHLASRCSGFGVTAASVELTPRVADGVGRMQVRVVLGDRWDPQIASLLYSYAFRPKSVGIRLNVAFRVPAGPPAFLKEPRVCFQAGQWAGFERMLVTEASGRLRQWSGSLPRTGQALPGPRVRHVGASHPQIDIEVAEAFTGWAEAAAGREQFGAVDGPGDGVVWDCHGGVPRQRFEMVRRANGEATFLLCAWQGGRGPYDCEPLSRAIAAESYGLSARITLG
jgi:hypothetical protein